MLGYLQVMRIPPATEITECANRPAKILLSGVTSRQCEILENILVRAQYPKCDRAGVVGHARYKCFRCYLPPTT